MCAVVHGDKIEQGRGGRTNHGGQGGHHDEEHEGCDHGAGRLHILGPGREDADGRDDDEHGADDEQEDECEVGSLVGQSHVELFGLFCAHLQHLGQRKYDAEEAGKAAEQSEA